MTFMQKAQHSLSKWERDVVEQYPDAEVERHYDKLIAFAQDGKPVAHYDLSKCRGSIDS